MVAEMKQMPFPLGMLCLKEKYGIERFKIVSSGDRDRESDQEVKSYQGAKR